MIEREIGRGGMGIVYLAEQLGRLKRHVALKVVAPEFSSDATYRQRFEREAQHAASLDHPNVVPVYEAGDEDGNLFLAMRYVDGLDCAAILREQGRFGATEAASVASQTAAALDAAHASGLVHRDVKPANILCVGGDPTGHVYLTDFGLTRQGGSSSAFTNTGRWVGTVDYVSPEQITRGRVDARADVYGLTCVLFHLLAGHPPYEGDEMQTMWAQVNEAPPELPNGADALSQAFNPVIARGMASAPEDRYPSAGDLGRAALAAARGSINTQPERTVAAGIAATGLDVQKPPSLEAPFADVAPPRRPSPARTAVMSGMQRTSDPREDSALSPRRIRWIVFAAVALVTAAAGAAGVIALTSGDNAGSTTTIAPSPTSSVPTTTPTPAFEGNCGNDDVLAGIHTSCAFAVNVRDAYKRTGSPTVSVFSPVTGKTYEMECTDSTPHVCTGATNASVTFP